MNNTNFNQFIALDLETTGLSESNDEIIEIAAHKFSNGKIQSSFSTLLNPGIKIPLFIENFTGIKNEMIQGKPYFHEIEDELVDFLGDFPIVGHNVMFDINFLSKKSKKIKNLVDISNLCDTYLLAKIFCFHYNSFSLVSLCGFFNINIDISHRASDDAKNSGYLFLKLLPLINNISITQLNYLVTIFENFELPNKKLLNTILNIIIKESKYIEDASHYRFNNNIIKYKSNAKLSNVSIGTMFNSNGILHKKVKDYESRSSQIELARDINDAFENSSYLVADAGPGIGKTFAYIVPGIISAINNKNKLIISTNTHSLQNQIFTKDLPIIFDAFDSDFKAVILKGINNYICLNRLYSLILSKDIVLSKEESVELMSLIVWSGYTETGDISECNSFFKKDNLRIWNLINYNPEFCLNNKCYSNNKCHYTELKKQSKNANIIVVNHSLLISHYNKDSYFLDDQSVCVIDEAHTFSNICREQLTEKLDLSLFFVLKDELNNIYLNQNNLDILNQDIYHFIIKTIDESINLFKGLCEQLLNSLNVDFKFSNVITYNIDNPNIFMEFEELDFIKNNINNIINRLKDCEKNQSINKNIKTIKSLIVKLESLKQSFSNIINRDNVIWLKIKKMNDGRMKYEFNCSPFFINNQLKSLYQLFNSIIFCSATIAIDDSFDFFITQMCLDSISYDKDLKYKKYISPYFYNDQSKLFVYNTESNLDDISYVEEIAGLIDNIISNVKNRRILVLCTSFKQINQFKKILNTTGNKNNFLFQARGLSRDILINSYLSKPNSVLFGTSTFWEGIDLPNDKLEILIIYKIPFSNPSNPIVKANIDYFQSKNINSFNEYLLPEAILKLKQGFGRLIRNHSDMGVCILTDPRIVKKIYGNKILESFPLEPNLFREKTNISIEVNKFFGNK